MFDYIYNFILNVLINTQITEYEQQAQQISVLLTFAVMICFVFVLIRLVRWAFDIPFKSWRIRK